MYPIMAYSQPYFNAYYYLSINPDLFPAGVATAQAAWEHYLGFGATEALQGGASRAPAPWFDAAWYLAQNPDLLLSGLSPAQLFEHFVAWGIREGRSPADGFGLTREALSTYAAANADLLQAFGIRDTWHLTDGQHEQLARHLYQYGYTEDRAGDPFVRPPEPESRIFTLTPDVDVLTGTAGDDLFQAPLVYSPIGLTHTLQPGDVIHGGAGDDTLVVDSAGGVISARVDGVEHLQLTSHVMTTLDAAHFSGLQTLTVTQSVAATTVRHLPELVHLVLRDQNGTVTLPAEPNHVTLGYGGEALAGHSAQFVTLDHVQLKAAGGQIFFDALAGGLDELDITVTGTSTLAGLAGAPGAFMGPASAVLEGVGTVRVHAHEAVDLGRLALPGLETFDASDSTAKVVVDLSLVASPTLTIRSGDGDGVFILDPAAHPGQQLVLSLGDGRDTLVLGDLAPSSPAHVVLLDGVVVEAADPGALEAALAAGGHPAGALLALWQDGAGQLWLAHDRDGAADHGGDDVQLIAALEGMDLEDARDALAAGELVFA